MIFRKKRKSVFKIIYLIFSYLVIIFSAIFSFYVYCEVNYKDRILPNVYAGKVDLSNKTVEEARKLINQKIDVFNLEGIVFNNSKKIYIYPVESSSSGEILNYLVFFDMEEALSNSMKIGHSGNVVSDYLARLRSILFRSKEVNYLSVKVDHEKILERIEKELSEYRSYNAYYYVDDNGELKVHKEVVGKKFDYDFKSLEDNLRSLNFSGMNLSAAKHVPEVVERDCLDKKGELENMLSHSPIYMVYKGENWEIEKRDLVSWVELSKTDKGFSFKINKDKVTSYIKENVSIAIDIPPQPPEFSIENGKLKDFKPGKDGLEVDIEKMVGNLSQFFVGQNRFEIEMKKARQVAEMDSSEGDFSGIKEIIGEYSLSFAGSSASRMKNIKNGASKISGAIIKPGEEFSTVKLLSPIDISNGYAKEAVINGGAITYEVGGGLCQLSTTLFRTILNTGLPITMRKNHTYDMSYYLPVGVDAAIYDPSPDFKFLNDTGNNILVVAWVDGVKLNMQVWGVRDGRMVQRTDPVRYNISRPGAAKIIPSSSLAKGVTQCSYASYIGSDTYFDYTVTYSDGTKKESRFSSHYAPRRGICYVGI
ncbi:MAG: VanW family protein [Candidatus Pacebacteria bacterium]|nr:VanW family protein [Candidatus Paceibacterota bacterium]